MGGSLVSMGAFVAFAAPLTWIAWREPAWARPWRIQPRRADPRRFAGASVRSWAVNNAAMFAVTLAAWPVLRRGGVHLGPLPSPLWMLAQLVLFIYLDDLLYYWMHRAMHQGELYRRVHAVHHRVPTPWAVSAHYMHPLEYVLTGGLMLVGPLVVGAHVATVYVWIAWRQWEAAEGHCGYAFPWSPTRWLPGSDGARHHDAHHARFHGNYGGFLYWTDALFGTLAKGYVPRRRLEASDEP